MDAVGLCNRAQGTSEAIEPWAIRDPEPVQGGSPTEQVDCSRLRGCLQGHYHDQQGIFNTRQSISKRREGRGRPGYGAGKIQLPKQSQGLGRQGEVVVLRLGTVHFILLCRLDDSLRELWSYVASSLVMALYCFCLSCGDHNKITFLHVVFLAGCWVGMDYSPVD